VSVDPELARRSGVPVRRGALVLKVYPDSPAAEAGLREKDVIVAIGGHPVAAREDVNTALYTVAPGTAVDAEVRRGSQTVRLRLRGVRPPQGLGLQVLEGTVGLTVEPVRGGLAIRRVAGGSVAGQRGLRPGDVILGANGQPVGSVDVLGREVLRGLDRGSLLLAVQRGNWVYNLDFPL
jgi:S1-C subfamily serine protease